MATGLECIRGALEAEGDKLSDGELIEILADVQQRAKARQAQDGLSSAERALFDAAEDVARDIDLAAIIERRNRAINVLRRDAIRQFLQRFGKDPALGIEALNVGINMPVEAGRLSVDARAKGLQARLLGGMIADLRKSGLLEWLTRRPAEGAGPIDREIARELWELDRPDGTPGVSGNLQARQIAAIIRKYQDTARRLQNDAGAWIRKIPGYIVRQSHDRAKLRRAGYEAWRDTILPLLDAEATFGGADPEKFLRAAYEGLVSGVHLKTTSGHVVGFKGPANLAKKLSAERVLHFKSADAWYDYNAAFGSSSLIEAVVSGLRRAADATALMEVWGTNPRAMFDGIIDELKAKHRADTKIVDRLNAKRLQNQFAEIDGSVRIPGDVTMARVGSGIRTMQRLAKLGGMVLSSITDVPMIAAELRYQGHGLLEGYAQALRSLMRGRETGEAREVADLVAAGIDGLLGDVMARFDSNDSVPGVLNRLQRVFMKLNLSNWWTDSHKTGVGLLMARRMAQLAGKSWDELGARRALMLQYGIGEREWDVLRRHAVREAIDGGPAYMTHDLVEEIPDEAAEALIADELVQVRDRYAERMTQAVERIDRMRARAEKLETILNSRRVRERDLEKLEIAGTLQALHRQWQATETLMNEVSALHAGKRINRTHRTLVRAIEDLAKAERRIGEETTRKLIRLRERLARQEARKDEARAKLEPLMEQIEAATRELADLPAAMERDIRRRIGRARSRLATSLATYYTDRIDYAVLTPGARERAILDQGLQAGTIEGEAIRLVMQFKAFPTTVLTKAWGREIYGSANHLLEEQLRRGKADYAGLAHLILASTVLGYVAMAAKDVAKGREPRDPTDPETWVAAFTQGGGAGIYADFVFGEFNRFGSSFFETMAGPTAGTVSDLARLWARAREGEDVWAQAFNVLKNHTPLLNVFYLRAALDYMVLYQVQEALNPGYLRRMERRIKRENGQRFIIPPSSVVD